MKKIALVLALAGFTTTFAQVNKNNTEKSTVTKTTVKSSKGEDVSTKKEIKGEKQEVKLVNTNTNKVNYSSTMSPVKIDTDISYMNEEISYTFQNNGSKYSMMTMEKDKPTVYAQMKPLSQKGYYLIIRENDNSVGYFNNDGDFVIESYEPNTEVLKTRIYNTQNVNSKKQLNALDNSKILQEAVDLDGDGMN